MSNRGKPAVMCECGHRVGYHKKVILSWEIGKCTLPDCKCEHGEIKTKLEDEYSDRN